MKVNALRVLMLTESIRSGVEPRVTVPKGTRVVVVNTKNGVITVRVHNSAPQAKTRLTVSPTQVAQTFRGRPKKTA